MEGSKRIDGLEEEEDKRRKLGEVSVWSERREGIG